ncbi:hypothetical protein MYX65_02315 [Acidobacteria bacterium AH-259-L09]|nr:hypothetical protein [Acidobacteria bacterium AH-259-L09]
MTPAIGPSISTNQDTDPNLQEVVFGCHDRLSGTRNLLIRLPSSLPVMALLAALTLLVVSLKRSPASSSQPPHINFIKAYRMKDQPKP